MSEEYRLDRPGALTCPECGGALTREENGSLLQFRCHWPCADRRDHAGRPL